MSGHPLTALSRATQPHTESVSEARERLSAERAGLPYLRWFREGEGWKVLPLSSGVTRVTIGRDGSCDVRLETDIRVSRTHAELVRVGFDWVLFDEGLSRNGTWVNGKRISGRVRLRDGATIRCGNSIIAFRLPARDSDEPSTQNGTVAAAETLLTPAQMAVLDALCRPLREQGPFAAPAPNAAIADELHLSVQTVKSHLRSLFTVFGLNSLPQNQKRARLAETAVRLGLVTVGQGE